MESVSPLRVFSLILALILTCLMMAGADAPEPAPEEQPPLEQPADPPVEETPPAEDPKSRPRPMTEAEEETYKRQVVREDPFLNAPPGPSAQNLAFYRPVDWLRPEIEFDSARYLIQDAA